MPFGVRTVEPSDIYGTMSKNVDNKKEFWSNDDDRTNFYQNAMCNLIHQMSNLGQFAEHIFSQLSSDIEQMSSRSSRLTERLNSLEDVVSKKLPNPKTLKISCVCSLERSYQIKEHFSSKQMETNGFFTPSTRPPHLKDAYIAAGRQGIPLRTESCATQTDYSALTKCITEDLANHDDGEQRIHSNGFKHDLDPPNPQSQTSTLTRQCKTDVIAVDVSGSTLKRMLIVRNSQQVSPATNIDNSNIKPRKRPIRRNTIALAREDLPGRVPLPKRDLNLDSVDFGKSETVPEEDIYDWTPASEFNYDYLPFEKGKKSLLSNMYASMRRRKRKSVENISKNVPETSTPTSVDTPQYGKVRKFLQRSVSLRLRTKKRWESVVYDQLPYQCVRPSSAAKSKDGNDAISRKDSLRRKLSLPLSTTSQVIHLASTLRREQPEGSRCQRLSKTSASSGYVSSRESYNKQRPVSIFSVTSNMSLDLDDRNSSQGWYRQGYQLDFPSECLKTGTKKASINYEHSSSSSQSSPRDPIADSPGFGSAAGDSTYSCDHEGYFTSMHKDSGIQPLVALPKHIMRRPTAVLSDSSCSTVTEEVSSESKGAESEIRPSDSSGDSGAEDLQSPYGDEKAQLEYERKIQITPNTAIPPLCEVSLSGEETPEIDQRSTNPPIASTLPKGGKDYDSILDQLLLSKFEAEMCLKGSESPKNEDKSGKTFFSLPRDPKPSPHNPQIGHCGVQMTSNTNLNMRKVVRFCE